MNLRGISGSLLSDISLGGSILSQSVCDIEGVGLKVGSAIRGIYYDRASSVFSFMAVIKIKVAQGDLSTEIYGTALRDLENTGRAILNYGSLIALLLNWQGDVGSRTCG